jgi:hypothetical protein
LLGPLSEVRGARVRRWWNALQDVLVVAGEARGYVDEEGAWSPDRVRDLVVGLVGGPLRALDTAVGVLAAGAAADGGLEESVGDAGAVVALLDELAPRGRGLAEGQRELLAGALGAFGAPALTARLRAGVSGAAPLALSAERLMLAPAGTPEDAKDETDTSGEQQRLAVMVHWGWGKLQQRHGPADLVRRFTSGDDAGEWSRDLPREDVRRVLGIRGLLEELDKPLRSPGGQSDVLEQLVRHRHAFVVRQAAQDLRRAKPGDGETQETARRLESAVEMAITKEVEKRGRESIEERKSKLRLLQADQAVWVRSYWHELEKRYSPADLVRKFALGVKPGEWSRGLEPELVLPVLSVPGFLEEINESLQQPGGRSFVLERLVRYGHAGVVSRAVQDRLAARPGDRGMQELAGRLPGATEELTVVTAAAGMLSQENVRLPEGGEAAPFLARWLAGLAKPERGAVLDRMKDGWRTALSADEGFVGRLEALLEPGEFAVAAARLMTRVMPGVEQPVTLRALLARQLSWQLQHKEFARRLLLRDVTVTAVPGDWNISSAPGLRDSWKKKTGSIRGIWSGLTMTVSIGADTVLGRNTRLDWSEGSGFPQGYGNEGHELGGHAFSALVLTDDEFENVVLPAYLGLLERWLRGERVQWPGAGRAYAAKNPEEFWAELAASWRDGGPWLNSSDKRSRWEAREAGGAWLRRNFPPPLIALLERLFGGNPEAEPRDEDKGGAGDEPVNPRTRVLAEDLMLEDYRAFHQGVEASGLNYADDGWRVDARWAATELTAQLASEGRRLRWGRESSGKLLEVVTLAIRELPELRLRAEVLLDGEVTPAALWQHVVDRRAARGVDTPPQPAITPLGPGWEYIFLAELAVELSEIVVLSSESPQVYGQIRRSAIERGPRLVLVRIGDQYERTRPLEDKADPFAGLTADGARGEAMKAEEQLDGVLPGLGAAGRALGDRRVAIRAEIDGLARELDPAERFALLHGYAMALYQTAKQAESVAAGDVRWMARLPAQTVGLQLARPEVLRKLAADWFLVDWLLQTHRPVMEGALSASDWAAYFLSPEEPQTRQWLRGLRRPGSVSAALSVQNLRRALGGNPKMRDLLLDQDPVAAANVIRVVPGAGRELFGADWIREVLGRKAIRDALFPPGGWPLFAPGVRGDLTGQLLRLMGVGGEATPEEQLVAALVLDGAPGLGGLADGAFLVGLKELFPPEHALGSVVSWFVDRELAGGRSVVGRGVVLPARREVVKFGPWLLAGAGPGASDLPPELLAAGHEPSEADAWLAAQVVAGYGPDQVQALVDMARWRLTRQGQVQMAQWLRAAKAWLERGPKAGGAAAGAAGKRGPPPEGAVQDAVKVVDALLAGLYPGVPAQRLNLSARDRMNMWAWHVLADGYLAGEWGAGNTPLEQQKLDELVRMLRGAGVQEAEEVARRMEAAAAEPERAALLVLAGEVAGWQVAALAGVPGGGDVTVAGGDALVELLGGLEGERADAVRGWWGARAGERGGAVRAVGARDWGAGGVLAGLVGPVSGARGARVRRWWNALQDVLVVAGEARRYAGGEGSWSPDRVRDLVVGLVGGPVRALDTAVEVLAASLGRAINEAGAVWVLPLDSGAAADVLEESVSDARAVVALLDELARRGDKPLGLGLAEGQHELLAGALGAFGAPALTARLRAGVSLRGGGDGDSDDGGSQGPGSADEPEQEQSGAVPSTGKGKALVRSVALEAVQRQRAQDAARPLHSVVSGERDLPTVELRRLVWQAVSAGPLAAPQRELLSGLVSSLGDWRLAELNEGDWLWRALDRGFPAEAREELERLWLQRFTGTGETARVLLKYRRRLDPQMVPAELPELSPDMQLGHREKPELVKKQGLELAKLWAVGGLAPADRRRLIRWARPAWTDLSLRYLTSGDRRFELKGPEQLLVAEALLANPGAVPEDARARSAGGLLLLEGTAEFKELPAAQTQRLAKALDSAVPAGHPRRPQAERLMTALSTGESDVLTGARRFAFGLIDSSLADLDHVEAGKFTVPQAERLADEVAEIGSAEAAGRLAGLGLAELGYASNSLLTVRQLLRARLGGLTGPQRREAEERVEVLLQTMAWLYRRIGQAFPTLEELKQLTVPAAELIDPHTIFRLSGAGHAGPVPSGEYQVPTAEAIAKALDADIRGYHAQLNAGQTRDRHADDDRLMDQKDMDQIMALAKETIREAFPFAPDLGEVGDLFAYADAQIKRAEEAGDRDWVSAQATAQLRLYRNRHAGRTGALFSRSGAVPPGKVADVGAAVGDAIGQLVGRRGSVSDEQYATGLKVLENYRGWAGIRPPGDDRFYVQYWLRDTLLENLWMVVFNDGNLGHESIHTMTGAGQGAFAYQVLRGDPVAYNVWVEGTTSLLLDVAAAGADPLTRLRPVIQSVLSKAARAQDAGKLTAEPDTRKPGEQPVIPPGPLVVWVTPRAQRYPSIETALLLVRIVGLPAVLAALFGDENAKVWKVTRESDQSSTAPAASHADGTGSRAREPADQDTPTARARRYLDGDFRADLDDEQHLELINDLWAAGPSASGLAALIGLVREARATVLEELHTRGQLAALAELAQDGELATDLAEALGERIPGGLAALDAEGPVRALPRPGVDVRGPAVLSPQGAFSGRRDQKWSDDLTLAQLMELDERVGERDAAQFVAELDQSAEWRELTRKQLTGYLAWALDAVRSPAMRALGEHKGRLPAGPLIELVGLLIGGPGRRAAIEVLHSDRWSFTAETEAALRRLFDQAVPPDDPIREEVSRLLDLAFAPREESEGEDEESEDDRDLIGDGGREPETEFGAGEGEEAVRQRSGGGELAPSSKVGTSSPETFIRLLSAGPVTEEAQENAVTWVAEAAGMSSVDLTALRAWGGLLLEVLARAYRAGSEPGTPELWAALRGLRELLDALRANSGNSPDWQSEHVRPEEVFEALREMARQVRVKGGLAALLGLTWLAMREMPPGRLVRLEDLRRVGRRKPLPVRNLAGQRRAWEAAAQLRPVLSGARPLPSAVLLRELVQRVTGAGPLSRSERALLARLAWSLPDERLRELAEDGRLRQALDDQVKTTWRRRFDEAGNVVPRYPRVLDLGQVHRSLDDLDWSERLGETGGPRLTRERGLELARLLAARGALENGHDGLTGPDYLPGLAPPDRARVWWWARQAWTELAARYLTSEDRSFALPGDLQVLVAAALLASPAGIPADPAARDVGVLLLLEGTPELTDEPSTGMPPWQQVRRLLAGAVPESHPRRAKVAEFLSQPAGYQAPRFGFGLIDPGLAGVPAVDWSHTASARALAGWVEALGPATVAAKLDVLGLAEAGYAASTFLRIRELAGAGQPAQQSDDLWQVAALLRRRIARSFGSLQELSRLTATAVGPTRSGGTVLPQSPVTGVPQSPVNEAELVQAFLSQVAEHHDDLVKGVNREDDILLDLSDAQLIEEAADQAIRSAFPFITDIPSRVIGDIFVYYESFLNEASSAKGKEDLRRFAEEYFAKILYGEGPGRTYLIERGQYPPDAETEALISRAAQAFAGSPESVSRAQEENAKRLLRVMQEAPGMAADGRFYVPFRLRGSPEENFKLVVSIFFAAVHEKWHLIARNGQGLFATRFFGEGSYNFNMWVEGFTSVLLELTVAGVDVITLLADVIERVQGKAARAVAVEKLAAEPGANEPAGSTGIQAAVRALLLSLRYPSFEDALHRERSTGPATVWAAQFGAETSKVWRPLTEDGDRIRQYLSRDFRYDLTDDQLLREIRALIDDESGTDGRLEDAVALVATARAEVLDQLRANGIAKLGRLVAGSGNSELADALSRVIVERFPSGRSGAVLVQPGEEVRGPAVLDPHGIFAKAADGRATGWTWKTDLTLGQLRDIARLADGRSAGQVVDGLPGTGQWREFTRSQLTGWLDWALGVARGPDLQELAEQEHLLPAGFLVNLIGELTSGPARQAALDILGLYAWHLDAANEAQLRETLDRAFPAEDPLRGDMEAALVNLSAGQAVHLRGGGGSSAGEDSDEEADEEWNKLAPRGPPGDGPASDSPQDGGEAGPGGASLTEVLRRTGGWGLDAKHRGKRGRGSVSAFPPPVNLPVR